jgi:glycerophosphoryl diester phosphodiesterase
VDEVFDRVVVIGHRGASISAPENTLPAFAMALAAGADGFELDYRHSCDGVPIAFHDPQLDRTTNACRLWGGSRISTASKTVAELRRLDAGAWFSADFSCTKIPTLQESLDALPPGAFAMLERKAGDPSTLIDLLTRHRAKEQVVVAAFDWSFVAECRRRAPDLPLGFVGQGAVSPARLRAMADVDVRFVAWNCADLDATTIADIRDLGLSVWSWTIDDPDLARRLVAAGVTGIITNDPRTMATVLKGRV